MSIEITLSLCVRYGWAHREVKAYTRTWGYIPQVGQRITLEPTVSARVALVESDDAGSAVVVHLHRNALSQDAANAIGVLYEDWMAG